LTDAAKLLGWTVHRFDYDLTKGVQDYLRAFNAALASHPDYLVVNFFGSTDLVSKQLAQAKSEGIPVIGSGTSITNNIEYMVQGPRVGEDSGKAMADVAVNDAHGAAKMAMPVDPTFAIFTNASAGIEKTVKAVAGSRFDKIEVSFGQPAGNNVSTIVNYLKAHPDTKYLLLTGAAFYNGLASGLQAAGLKDKVKLILSFPYDEDLPAVKSGAFFAVVGAEIAYEYREVDAMARLATKAPIEDKSPTNVFHLLTAQNASSETLNPPNWVQAFKKAWGV
jgi:ABC-type sugar transport system substrate-binding protein